MCNVGLIDRLVRAIAGVALIAAAWLYFQESATTKYILTGAGALLFLTSAIAFCPLYKVLGVTTCKPKNSSTDE